MNAQDITTHAADALAAGDWGVVAVVMNAVQVTASPRLCYAIESGAAVEDSGNDSTAMLNILLADPNGTMIFQKLSSSAGVEWAHPKTQQLLSYFVAYAAMPVAVKNALTELSAPTTFPFADVTAEQCQTAYDLAELVQQWSTLQNEVINPAANVRADLIVALRSAADLLEAG